LDEGLSGTPMYHGVVTTAQLLEPFRRRLLDGLAQSIVEDGYQSTTVADIVGLARTSRRTFYEHFASKEECFAALLTDVNASMIQQISSAVDRRASWSTQVRQAVEAWIGCAEGSPAITVSMTRDLPALGARGREVQREIMAAFVAMVQTLCGTEEWRAVREQPVSRQLATLLVGGLHELIATTVEDGGRASDITETAVEAVVALLGPPAVR
jgi:AcrR family transcriptional regulator